MEKTGGKETLKEGVTTSCDPFIPRKEGEREISVGKVTSDRSLIRLLWVEHPHYPDTKISVDSYH